MWLGPLTELRTPGLLPSPSRGQLAAFSVTEFGGLYGAGGIGSLTQPLLGEAVLSAALPAVVLSVMLSVEYKVATREMASTLLISMLGSIVTISVFIFLVQ